MRRKFIASFSHRVAFLWFVLLAVLSVGCVSVPTVPDSPKTAQAKSEESAPPTPPVPQAKSIEIPRNASKTFTKDELSDKTKAGKSYADIRKLDKWLPDAADGDEFMMTFRPEEYLSTREMQVFIRSGGEPEMRKRRYRIAFEKEDAEAEYRTRVFKVVGQNKPTPEFLYFPVIFTFKPASWISPGRVVIQPEFATAGANIRVRQDVLPPGRAVNSRSLEANANGMQYKTVARRIQAATYDGIRISDALIALRVGFDNQNWVGQGSTNFFDYLSVSKDQFKNILANGNEFTVEGYFPFAKKGQLNDRFGIYYRGFAVYKSTPVDDGSKLGSSVGVSTSVVLNYTPVNLVILDFLGKEAFVHHVKTIKLGS